jgi:thioredoxin reductase (NADPH)
MFTGLSESDRRRLPAGQLMITTEVENYPGFPGGMTGPALMERFQKQAERFGTVVQMESVVSLDRSQRPFRIQGESTTGLSDSNIIAIGASAEWLNVPGEAEYMSRGVSACATCDGPFFKGRDVLVVGGGDAAMEEATHLTKRGQTAGGLAG